MKILTPAVAAICLGSFCIPASAQISKGDWLLGTSIGTATTTSSNDADAYQPSSTSYSGTTQTTTGSAYSLTLSPQVGYFVAGNLAIGGMLSFSLSSSRTNEITTASTGYPSSLSNSTSYTFTAGPFIRYYFGDIVLSKTLFFMQASGRIGTSDANSSGSGARSTYTYTSSGSTSGGAYWLASGELGLVHFISKSVGLIAYAGYTYNGSSGTTLSTTNYSYKAPSTGTPSTSTNYNYNNASGQVTISVGFNIYLEPKSRK